MINIMMMMKKYKGVFVLVVYFWVFPLSSSSYKLHPLIESSREQHWNHTAISDFRLINRRALFSCQPDAFGEIKVDPEYSLLSDDQTVEVTVIGMKNDATQPLDWVAMITPSTTANELQYSYCSWLMYYQTGDLSDLPLICHYPVKAQYVSNDPDYLECKNSGRGKLHNELEPRFVTTCKATLKFHVVNFRSNISFVMFSGGFKTPCKMVESNSIRFGNPNQPLYGHLSSIDSTGTSMKLTWVSGQNEPQTVEYANGRSQISTIVTFTKDDMRGIGPIHYLSPAKDFGWHDPGFIHSAIMKGLEPSSTFAYRYGSESAGWSEVIKFTTPPKAGDDEVRFLAFGDMGKTPLDKSVEHYMQPGSLAVVNAMKKEVDSGDIDSIFHIGDISYATGFMVEWDYFLHQITPLASRVSYMTAIGNHERDYPFSGSFYRTTDSGGECGVPYEAYFQMPVEGRDRPWYSIEQGPVHFTVISTENNWSFHSEQYNWTELDLASVNRSVTPWLVFTGHRPMYSSTEGEWGLSTVDEIFVSTIEPLLRKHKVDLVLFGHVHNYERTCAVFKGECAGMPERDEGSVVDRYDLTNYGAPVQVVIGMAGFKLDPLPEQATHAWSLVRRSMYGYLKVHATRTHMNVEFVAVDTESDTITVEDRFLLFKREPLQDSNS